VTVPMFNGQRPSVSKLDLPPCPACGGVLRLEMKLEAKLVSLAGAQMKLGAREWPYLVCDRCPFEEAGKVG
jgi:hypothetical protein